MFKLFTKYLTVGVFNTLLHWLIFAGCYYLLDANQAVSNLVAFCVAVTFSFFTNARFTFQTHATTHRFLLYTGFMGALSVGTGWFADQCGLPPLFTLISFSAISLICGFLYSKFIVFRSTST